MDKYGDREGHDLNLVDQLGQHVQDQATGQYFVVHWATCIILQNKSTLSFGHNVRYITSTEPKFNILPKQVYNILGQNQYMEVLLYQVHYRSKCKLILLFKQVKIE